MRKFWIGLMLFAGAASVQDDRLRDGEDWLSLPALEKRLVGQTVTFFDDGQSYYYEDGRYTYTYGNDGGSAYGYYELGADGTVCIEFVNGFSRCDQFIQADERLMLLTEKGVRFPIRPAE